MSDKGAKEIIKGSSIIAGAQVIQIIFGIIRTKFIAVLLGPIGVGESGLYQSINQLVISIFGLGISQSSVKAIAEKGKDGIGKLNNVISSSIILVTILGIIAVIATIILSNQISRYTFQSTEYGMRISILSISIMLNMLYACFTSIAQGLRKLKLIALISVYSSIVSLFVTIPIYYIWGIKGIVPALILMSITNLTISIYFVKPQFKFILPHFSILKAESYGMIKVGVALALSSIFMMVSNYLIRVFVSDKIGIEGVGYMNAATAITTLYLSLIFTAMSTDFYPKLAGLKMDKTAMNKAVNEQINVGLIIAGPIIIVFVSFSLYILNILYSNKFSAASELLQYQLLGTLFKAFSWPIGFILLTTNLSKVFIFTEFIWNFSYYILTLLFWKYFGLSTVGISYLISYFIYTIIIFAISNKSNNFTFNRSSILTFLIVLILSFGSFVTFKLVNNHFAKWGVVSGCILLGSFYSYLYLAKLYNFKEILKTILSKYLNK